MLTNDQIISICKDLIAATEGCMQSNKISLTFLESCKDKLSLEEQLMFGELVESQSHIREAIHRITKVLESAAG